MWKNNGKRKPKNGTYCRAGYKCVPKEMGVGQGGGKEERPIVLSVYHIEGN